MKNKILAFTRKNVAWVILVVECIVFSILAPQFSRVANLMLICRQVAVSGIMAIGVAFVMIAGNVDLSTSSQVAFTGMLCAYLNVRMGWNFIPAALVAITANVLLMGCVNGFVVAYTNMPAMIASLGTMNIGSGLAYLISRGSNIFGLSDDAKIVGQNNIGGLVPVSILVMGVALIIGGFVLDKTRFGRTVFAVGSNKEAARLSGIHVKRVTILSFIICSIFVGLGGCVLMSRLNSGIPTAGSSLFLDVTIACVVGGISSAGGEGRLFGLLGGVLMMGAMSNGMSVLGLQDYWQNIVQGIVLIISVGADSYRRTMAAEKKAHVIRSSQKNEQK